MGKEYKITITCENRDKYVSRWIEDREPDYVDELHKTLPIMECFSFVDELGYRTIFLKECLAKSVIQIKERIT